MAKTSPYTVWLKESAYNVLLVDAIKFMPKETGGVVLGYWGNSYEVVITEIIGPGPKAAHNCNSFVPDNDYHIKEIERVYRRSVRTESYLGDWHTHPDSNAYMSGQDIKTIRKIADHDQSRLENPLMMVLGTKPFGLLAWILTMGNGKLKNNKVIEECSIIIYSDTNAYLLNNIN